MRSSCQAAAFRACAWVNDYIWLTGQSPAAMPSLGPPMIDQVVPEPLHFAT